MFIPVIAIFVVAVLGLVLKRSRRVLYNDFSAYSEKERFVAQLKRLAKLFVMPEKFGKGIELQPVEKYIKKAYRVIKRKVVHGDELYEFERWLYENNYVFKRIFKTKAYETYFDLPHVGNTPRVILFARAVVALSQGRLDKERVEIAVRAVNEVAPLTYSETEALDSALQYAILEKIAAVGKKCVYYHRMLRLAAKAKNIAKKYVSHNLYVYYTIKKNPKLSDKLKAYMDENARRYDNIDYAFSALIVENNVLTSALVTSLMHLGEFTEGRLKLGEAYAVMCGDNIFVQSDAATKKFFMAEIGRLSDKINLNEGLFARCLLDYARHNNKSFALCLIDDEASVLKSVGDGAVVIAKKKRRIKGFAYVAVNVALTLLLSAVAGVSAMHFGAGIAVGILGIIGLIAPSYFIANRLFAAFLKEKPVCRMSFTDIPDFAKTEVIMPVYAGNEKSLRNHIRAITVLKEGNRFSNLRFTLLIDFKRSDGETSPADEGLLKILREELPSGVGAAVRRRTLCDGVYLGRERKRGAVEDYACYLASGDKKDFTFISQDYEKPAYFLVLDADSVLEPQAVLRLINAFLHPVNASYDLLALSGKTNLYSLNTCFSKSFAKEGGREAYPEYSSLFSQLTGNALFTGKGIFRLEAYCDKLCGRLPENKILSHDLLEGALLDTGLAGESVYEDAPSSFGAFEDRRLRWARGDVQLLPFLGIKKHNGKSICAVNAYVMFLNAFSLLYEPYILVLFLLSAFLRLPWLAVFAAAVVSLEFCVNTFLGFFGIFMSRRARYYIAEVFSQLLRVIASVFLLPYRAVINLTVFIVTICRMTFTKRGLLNWKPFAESQEREKSANTPSEKTTRSLLRYAADTFKYFDAATKDGLVADHITMWPKGTAANYTSPTDIGFSLVAEASAALLGIKDFKATEDRVNDILDAAFALKKWNGHLYNWYDLATKKPLSPSFVSSVDSGNFIACLYTIKGIYGENISKKIENYLKTVNFMSLFDKERGQFYIGYNSDKRRFEGHYDNLVSEARLLVYLGVASGVSAAAWDNLSRDFTALRGNTLLSWGGTAFEYLMAGLFLPPPKMGLIEKSTKNAVEIMKRTKCKGLWGISESGYFDFDDNRNFKYKAFGVDNLSLKSEPSSCVISPYSTFLALEYSGRAAIKNLKKIVACEGYGEYGFYEALDFTGPGRIVTEYMAHHQGMIMAAVANCLTDGALRDAFLKSAQLVACLPLMCEKNYEGKAFKPEKNKFIYDRPNLAYPEIHCNVCASPLAAILTGGDYSVVIDDAGSGYSKCGDIFVTRFRPDINRSMGAFFLIDDGEVSSPTAAPLFSEENMTAVFLQNEAKFVNARKGYTQTVFTPAFFPGELRRLKIENTGEKSKSYKVAYFAELALNTLAADLSHRAYSDMFVESEVREGVLYASRRGRGSDEGLFAALLATGAEVSYISNRLNFWGRGGCKIPVALSGRKAKPDDNGAVLNPCLAFVTEVEVPAGGEVTIDVFTAVTDNKDALSAALKRAKNPNFTQLIKKIPFIGENTSAFVPDSHFARLSARLLPKLLYTPYSSDKLYEICKCHQQYERYSDCFNCKVLLFRYDDNRRELKQATGLLQSYLAAGIRVSLIISYEERDEYFTPVRREIMKTISGEVGKDIFLVSDIPYDRLLEICFYDLHSVEEERYPIVNPHFREAEGIVPQAEPVLESGEGYFTKEGYEVVPFGKTTLLPYSNVICGMEGGTVVTQGGGGYTYYGNSRESKLTVWENDFVADKASEELLFWDGRSVVNLLKGAHYSMAKGVTHVCGACDKFSYKVSIYTVCEGGAKVYDLDIVAQKPLRGGAVLNLDLSLGTDGDKSYVYVKEDGGILEAVNLKTGISCYLKAVDGGYLNEFYPHSRGCGGITSAFGARAYSGYIEITLGEGERKRAVFAFGGNFGAVSSVDADSVDGLSAESISRLSHLNPVRVKSDNPALDILFNDCLMYQTVSARINGRTSFYQAGGAVGFRDILQDCLSLMYSDEARAREIILDCAAHTYFEGDVMHWWHGEKHGVRTRISDDGLFLPYVVTEYIMVSGDYDILDEDVGYLDSRPLAAGEDSRYEVPEYHEKRESLILHLERIVDNAYRTGENGLLLIRGGDWNDALNAVGTDAAGESVWLTEFYIEVLTRMKELYDGRDTLLWLDRINRLKEAVCATFTGKQFKRLITASGEWLGDGYSKEMKIDVISQAWASIASIGDKKYRDNALNMAKKMLFDMENGLFMLLTPPFSGEKYYGYISRYPAGVRENGGQYTHGAMWFIWAFIKEGRVDEAYEILNAVNPIVKCIGRNGTLSYMAEPYVLAADVYSNAAYRGRAGWSWYTGSASWCWKIILEGFFGIKKRGNRLEIKPNLPACFNHATVTYRYGSSRYEIEMVRTGRRVIMENGVEFEGVDGIALREGENRRLTVKF